MQAMNIFTGDAFTAVSMTAAIDKADYIPQYLSTIPGLVTPEPVRTEVIWIEMRETGSVILPFSPRGAPPHQTGGDVRNVRAFSTLRYSDASRITASELFAIRAFNSEISLKDAASEIARRQQKLKQNFQLTREYHLFNLVTQAKVIDADKTTVKVDWQTEFGLNIPAEVGWDLANATPANGITRKRCADVRRSMQVNLKGVGVISDVIGLCDDGFWNALIACKEVQQTYLNWSAAADLRGSIGKEWSTFRFGDITFVNYRSTDPTVVAGTSQFGLAANTCKFFPTGTGVFKWALSPGEAFAHLGQLGQDMYSVMVIDQARDQWADVEAYTYPLPVCTNPSVLFQAKAAA
jgi:hypothetical protein